MATRVAPNSIAEASPLPFDATSIIQLVEAWEDLLELRKRMSNRIWAIRNVSGPDGTTGEPDPAILAYFEALQTEETALKKALVREWRKHPLAPWAKEIKGVGEHSIAIIVAYLGGDPYIQVPKWWVDNPDFNPDKDAGRENPKRTLRMGEPQVRTIAQLRAYCGYGSPELRRKRGMTQDDALSLGNPHLKSRLYVLMTSFMLHKPNPHSDLYYAARERYADRKHEGECPQCHAKAGDPWKPGHQQAAAYRFVIKRFLKELWLAAREVHTA